MINLLCCPFCRSEMNHGKFDYEHESDTPNPRYFGKNDTGYTFAWLVCDRCHTRGPAVCFKTFDLLKDINTKDSKYIMRNFIKIYHNYKMIEKLNDVIGQSKLLFNEACEAWNIRGKRALKFINKNWEKNN